MSRLEELIHLGFALDAVPGMPPVNALEGLYYGEQGGAMLKDKLRALVGEPDDPGTAAQTRARALGQAALDFVPTRPSEFAAAYAGGKAIPLGAKALAKKFPRTLGMDVGKAAKSRLSALFDRKAKDPLEGFDPRMKERPVWEGLTEEELAQSTWDDFWKREAANLQKKYGNKRELDSEINSQVDNFMTMRSGLGRKLPKEWLDDPLRILGNNRGQITLGPDGKLPIVPPGAKDGPAHALFAYTDDFGEDGAKRVMVNVFGNPEDPLVKQVGYGSTIPIEQAEAAGIPIVGREPRSVKWEFPIRKAS